MHVGKLVFTHNFMRDGQKKRIMRLNHDMKRLQATVSQPDEGMIQLFTHITSAHLKYSLPWRTTENGVTYPYWRSCNHWRQSSLGTTNGWLVDGKNGQNRCQDCRRRRLVFTLYCMDAYKAH